MRRHLTLMAILLATTAVVPVWGSHYTRDFRIEECNFDSRGRNPYFSINPGDFLRLEGINEEGALAVVEITVLSETRTVRFETPRGQRMTVRTRIIEEREWEDGELIEISRNYYARCKHTDTIFYFGESVRNYENGVLVSRDGSWLAGRAGAQPGVIMPGMFFLGAQYFQEYAPEIALDRAKHVRMGLTVTTPAGTFEDCVKVVESTPLEPGARGIKVYAPGVGLIIDDDIELVATN